MSKEADDEDGYRCTNCGSILNGNVRTDWERIQDPYDRAEGRTEAPLVYCEECDALVDRGFEVTKELFESVGKSVNAGPPWREGGEE